MDGLYKIDESYYYVYEHWLRGEVIYVGKGRNKRALSRERNTLWLDRVNEDFEELEVIIKGHFKAEKDAFKFEKFLIESYVKEGIELTNISSNSNLSLDEKAFSERKQRLSSYFSSDELYINSSNMLEKLPISNDYEDLYNESVFSMETIYSNDFQVIPIINEEVIVNKRKTVIFYDYKEEGLIESLQSNKKLKMLLFSPSLEEKELYRVVEYLIKGDIPDPYNILVIPIEYLRLYNFKTKDSNLKLVIVNSVKKDDIKACLSKLSVNGGSLYCKTKDNNFDFRYASLSIQPFYLDIPLTADDKDSIIKHTKFLSNTGEQMSWEEIRDLIKKGPFYKIEYSIDIIDGKRTESTVIKCALSGL